MSQLLAPNGPPTMSAVWSLSGGKQTWGGQPILVENDPDCVKTPTPDLRVERFVSNRLNKKRTALATAVETRKERKQFRAFSTLARFHTGAPGDRQGVGGASPLR